ncbi:MAG: endonuclease [Planctomycetes bacterium]|nr:endonuclease [Planctomycetota bacterium]
MNVDELSSLLRQSLADHKLTPSEKTALSGWFTKNVQTDQQRGVARHTAFEIAKLSLSTADATIVGWLEDVMRIFAPMGSTVTNAPGSSEPDQAFFAPGERCLQQIVHRFLTVRHTADVCVFTITDDRISRAIADAHRRGVKLRIISDTDKAFDPGSDIQRFREAGIPVKTDDIHKHSEPGQNGHMHHKFAIFDGVRLLNGSYNWTRGAADMNYENIVDTGDSKQIAVFAAEFERLWNRF